MKLYETLFISPPTFDDESVENVIRELKDLVLEFGGAVEQVEKWGKRELAYEIDDFREGFYTLIHYRVPGDAIDKIRHKFKFSEGVLRYLIVKKDTELETKEDTPEHVDEASE